MDVDGQNFMTLEDFQASLIALGFRGDARLLFRGLDVGGAGRIMRNEFSYIGKVSRFFQKPIRGRQQLRAMSILDFSSWVQCQTGGLAALLADIGFSTDETEFDTGMLA